MKQLVVDRGLIRAEQLDLLLSPERMTRPYRPTATGSIPSLAKVNDTETGTGTGTGTDTVTDEPPVA